MLIEELIEENTGGEPDWLGWLMFLQFGLPILLGVVIAATVVLSTM